MKNEQTFKINSLFKFLVYDHEVGFWSFIFGEDITLSIQTIWRLLENDEIKYVSLDHGQLFGLSDPLNLVEILKEEFQGIYINEIKIKKNTSDLLLTFSNNLQMEIFITSSSYESYTLLIDEKKYIGMGGGEIAIFPI